MIAFLLVTMCITMVLALLCAWVVSWSKNSFSNANLELVVGVSGSIFLIALGILFPLLGFKYQDALFSDDELVRSGMVLISAMTGLSLCIAGAGLMFKSIMEVIDDFKWAFNKKNYDKERTHRRPVKKNRN